MAARTREGSRESGTGSPSCAEGVSLQLCGKGQPLLHFVEERRPSRGRGHSHAPGGIVAKETRDLQDDIV